MRLLAAGYGPYVCVIHLFVCAVLRGDSGGSAGNASWMLRCPSMTLQECSNNGVCVESCSAAQSQTGLLDCAAYCKCGPDYSGVDCSVPVALSASRDALASAVLGNLSTLMTAVCGRAEVVLGCSRGHRCTCHGACRCLWATQQRW